MKKGLEASSPVAVTLKDSIRVRVVLKGFKGSKFVVPTKTFTVYGASVDEVYKILTSAIRGRA